MEKSYTAKIAYEYKPLTAVEKAKYITGVEAIALDEAVTPDESVKCVVNNLIALAVHNEKAENTDYTAYYIEATNGNVYYTSSLNCFEKLSDILDILVDHQEENIQIKFFKSPSKNYKGKYFLNCCIA